MSLDNLAESIEIQGRSGNEGVATRIENDDADHSIESSKESIDSQSFNENLPSDSEEEELIKSNEPHGKSDVHTYKPSAGEDIYGRVVADPVAANHQKYTPPARRKELSNTIDEVSRILPKSRCFIKSLPCSPLVVRVCAPPPSLDEWPHEQALR